MNRYAYRTLNNHEITINIVYKINNNKTFILLQDGKRNEHNM